MNGVTLTERQRAKWRRWFEGWRWETDVQAATTETLENPTWIYWSPATAFPTQEERMKAAAAGYRIETVSKNWWTVCWKDFSGGNLAKWEDFPMPGGKPTQSEVWKKGALWVFRPRTDQETKPNVASFNLQEIVTEATGWENRTWTVWGTKMWNVGRLSDAGVFGTSVEASMAQAVGIMTTAGGNMNQAVMSPAMALVQCLDARGAAGQE